MPEVRLSPRAISKSSLAHGPKVKERLKRMTTLELSARRVEIEERTPSRLDFSHSLGWGVGWEEWE